MENSVTSLVTTEQTIPLADSRHIAQELGIEHQNFFEMMKDYQQEIEEDFGLIRFQTDAVKKPGSRGTKYIKYALLTEDQTYAYLAYSKNTEQARTCKRKLIKAFSVARESVLTLQVAPHADLTNLTARQIRMVGLIARIIDLANEGQSYEHLMHLFIAECQSPMLADRIWESPSPKLIQRTGPPVF